MRPEFGCRIHDHVFAPVNAATAGPDRLRRAVRAGAVGAADRRRTTSWSASTAPTPGTLYIDIHYSIRGMQRPAQPGLPVLRDPRRARTAARSGRHRRRSQLPTEWLSMVLPAPNLDDRHFQDLVDDAKRLVQQRCPEWTDHNVSDPGVTLIEAFAQMVDQLIYRLNRVPGPALHQVPRADRRRAAAAGRGPRARSRSGCRRRSRRPCVVRARRPRWPRRAPTSPTRSSSPRSRTWRSCPARSHGPARWRPAARRSDHTTALRAGGEFECFSAARRSRATRC